MNTTPRTGRSASPRTASTWPTISCARRLRDKPSPPVAQNAQASAAHSAHGSQIGLSALHRRGEQLAPDLFTDPESFVLLGEHPAAVHHRSRSTGSVT